MSTSDLIPRAIAIDELAPMVGHKLLVDCNPRIAELTLLSVKPLKNAHGTRLPFVAIFHSAPEVFLVQGTYAMRCGEFGPDLIDIIPLDRPMGSEAPPGHFYQAVFN